MASGRIDGRRDPTEFRQAVRDALDGALLRRVASMGRAGQAGEALFLGRDGAFRRERGAGSGASGRWAIEAFLDEPALVLRQAGRVSTVLPVAVGGAGVVLLGGAAWRRETGD